MVRLEQLFPRGTHLADVPPEVRGLPLRLWKALNCSAQCDEYLRKNPMKPEDAPLSKHREWNKRDDYGVGGITGRSRSVTPRPTPEGRAANQD